MHLKISPFQKASFFIRCLGNDERDYEMSVESMVVLVLSLHLLAILAFKGISRELSFLLWAGCTAGAISCDNSQILIVFWHLTMDPMETYTTLDKDDHMA